MWDLVYASVIFFVCVAAGLLARVSVFGYEGLNNPTAIIFPSLYGILGAVLTTLIGRSMGWYEPGLGPLQAMHAIIGAVMAITIWVWLQRFRQFRREADERAGGRAELPVAEKAAPEQMAAVSRSATAKRAKRTRRIFISYRREGDAALAGRIADLLGPEFGPDNVFMDVDAIRLGVDFVEVINEEVAKCDVLLAVIGRNWLDARNEAGQRLLDAPVDFVRIEIAAALKRQIPVIPILVDGTKIPPADRLPEELKELERRNALDLRNASFRADMDRLVRELKPPESAFVNFVVGFLRGFGGYR
jgi:uncharacterized membrane protein YeaQ/YmgE (transglycosylase-associated protein family)